MIFADKLIQLRKKAGWSQEELAEQMDVTRQSVSKWEGAQAIPDIEIVPFDERFTSVLAHKAMLDGGLGKMARRDKALVDEISATIILNDYLSSRAYQSEN